MLRLEVAVYFPMPVKEPAWVTGGCYNGAIELLIRHFSIKWKSTLKILQVVSIE